MFDKKLFRFNGIKSLMIKLAEASFLQAVLIIIQTFYLSLTLSALWKGAGLRSQLMPILIFALAFFLRHSIDAIRDKKISAYSSKQGERLREQLLTRIFFLGPRLVREEGAAHLTVTCLEGILRVEEYLALVPVKMLNMALIPVITIIAAFIADPLSAGIMLAGYPIVIVFMMLLGLAAQKKADSQFDSYKLLSNHFMDSLQGLETLAILGKSRGHADSVFNVSERYRKATMGTLKVAMLSTFALDFFTTLSIAVIALLLGTRLFMGSIRLFPALFILILAPEYFLPLREFANDYHATLDGKNALHAILNIIDEKIVLQQNTVQLNLWNKDSEFACTGISYTYKNSEKPAVHNFSFRWNGTGKIGIIGKSGSGKSTLIDLLAGFTQPDTNSGGFSINGQHSAHLTEKNWQKQIVYIPQNTYIFHASIADNIRFYEPSASLDEVKKAAEQSGLLQFIESLPEGFETLIGEKGRALSGGQAQRIALARAFLANDRHIILFDEPTAHLDIETELEIKKAMLPLFENRLVFFSTHRLHWMREMDTILVLENGALAEQGTHEELLAKNGAYTQLVAELRGGND
ncbi:MAG: thiol reductant ABC exporter subunit CydD [Treponema phagedenis]|uniref:ATP-binding/permease protein CydC n=2 Tax=Treponema phagedenis TaxID=162 RepID=A0A0B7GZ69_TREPH|nr:thiol reductant ABC exporter subunit CydD [Treponema phagedenis]CEM61956.1 ATP-binding/permease protein CydC [Treponema phagedenis]